ncbi:hypothetical protein [Microbacterium binotii]|uniref:hypothetical protein n=1 Tax=Microbacterium binotii TaxID=462710 RepID=UPI001F330072|nr:hypothetical protein [Microbacterium binotii]UIN31268.1 hypothetical protein LXM64_03420 [Microbacterium binotii]
MSAPQPPVAPSAAPTTESSSPNRLVRAGIWVAIGALIAAALVSVVWVLIGSQNGIVGRAFLTIFLLAAFAGVSILDAHLAPRRPGWFVLTSMIAWVLILIVGAFLIWMPERPSFDDFRYGAEGLTAFTRFFSFLMIVLIVQLAVLHVRLYTKAIVRVPTLFNRIVGYVTVGLVAALVVLLVLPLTIQEWVDFYDVYWRIVVAVTILAAVGTALVPLVNLLFGPKTPRAQTAPPTWPVAAPQAWPTYADRVTPLPVLPDGSPDWQAYYTGYPTGWHQTPPTVSPTAEAAYGAQPPASAAPVTPSEPPAAPGYEGFPPPPPLPPR